MQWAVTRQTALSVSVSVSVSVSALRFVCAQQHLLDITVAMPAAVRTLPNFAAALVAAAHTHGCCKYSLNRAASADRQARLPASTGVEQCACLT